ncbi:MAG: heme ABC exporter ATP-binding protein CcmA [Shimia sp.]
MSLSVTDLTVARGGLRLLEGVSFNIPDGTALILRGANGIGKTTLLRTLAGLTPAAGGTIDPAPERIAYAGHADAVKASLSVAENLRFWARLRSREDMLGEVMEAFALRALADRPGAALSAGQKRRTGLARLMLSGRPVWLLDEPTVALDTQAQGMLFDMLRTHLGQGGCALLSTHVDVPLDAATLDLTPYRAKRRVAGAFAEALE